MARVSVRYIVDDVDAAIDFYCRELGFDEVMHPAPSFAMLSHGDLRLVAAAYYAGDRNIARKQLDYRNPDVVAYVQAVRRQYMLRRYSAVRPLRRSTP